MPLGYLFGGICYPAAGSNRRRGSPKTKKREGSQLLLQSVPQVHGLTMAVRQFPPIRWIEWSWSHCKIRRAVHVVPPKQVGHSKTRIFFAQDVPDLLALYELVGLSPKLDFTLLFKVPAISNDSIFSRPLACEVGGLSRAGHCWKHGLHHRLVLRCNPLFQKWGVLTNDSWR